MNHINGLIAAPFTPFENSGELKLEIVEKQVKFLVEHNVRGAFIGGTTGEGMSLTIDERKRLAERWKEISPDDFKVIIQCGHASLAACKELAEHAGNIGAYAIGAMGTVFHKPSTVEDLVSFTAELASVNPDLPFYYYHIPSMTGLDFPMIEYLELSSGQIPNLAGIKFTHNDLIDFKLCREFEDSKYDMLYGRDETLLCGLVLGAKGAIGSTYNYSPYIYHEIINAWEEGDISLANRLQHEVMKFVRVLNKYGGGVVAGKAIMKLVGIDCGPVRLPLKSLSGDELLKMEAELEETGFFDFAKR